MLDHTKDPWPEPCEAGCGMLILPPDPLRGGQWPCEGEPIGDLGYAVKGPHSPQRCQQLRSGALPHGIRRAS